MPEVETREAGTEAAAQVAKPPEQPTPTEKPEAGGKIYSEVEFQAKADGLLKTQYNTLNATLSTQGVELAKLRPMEAENGNLRATVKKLNDEIDDKAIADAPENPSYTEVIKMRRTLRNEKSEHEDTVREHNVKVAAFSAKETLYDTWDDQHNMENANSIAFIADKFKVKPEALKDIPKEGRAIFAERLAGAKPLETPGTPATPLTTEQRSPLENGVGQGGSQLTGDAASAAALARAREKYK